MPKKKIVSSPAGTQGTARLAFPVVAIGCSAGGLEALQILVKGLPDNPGAAFVIISHIGPTHKSLLADILGSHTALPVRQAEHGMPLEVDSIFIIPPGKIMRIASGRLLLSDRTDAKDHHHPIDLFFTSLAQDQGDNALCIILSGTGADGSEGLRAIKEADGLALVQSAETASHPGMPESAAETGLADAVLPIEDIPVQLDKFLRMVMSVGRQPPSRGMGTANLKQMQKLLALVQVESGHDLSGYKLSTISRRIHKRMLLVGNKTLKSYVEFVEGDQAERSALLHEILIRVTRFFRDPEAFAALRQQLLIPLMQRKSSKDTLRIWVAGCSTGEEAYTLAMLVSEYLEASHRQCLVKIFATDIDETAIAAARRGIFNSTIARDVPRKLLSKYFLARGSDYIAAPVLREMILFSVHDILRDPPFFRMDLVVCRNLLIYLGNEAQQKALSLFYATLNQGGGLFLGPSEAITEHLGLFEAVDKRWRIFRRRDAGTRPLRLAVQNLRPAVEFPFLRAAELPHAPADTAGLVDRAQAMRYGQACVLVDAETRIVRIEGDISRYMEIPQGDLSNNLYKYVKKPLRLQLRSAVKNAIKTRQPVEMRNLHLGTSDGHLVSLIIEPLDHIEGGAGLLLVIFEEAKLPPLPDGHTVTAALTESEVVAQLDEELKTTKDQLQEAIESFEGMNEELRASNEELVSMNEEIQSSYEELETSGEELQALNEELTVMNTELQAKVEELDSANSYLDNLLKSSSVATVFLDRELCIMRFTPAASELFHLRAADVRRPITEIVNQIKGFNVTSAAQNVLATLQVAEHEVETTDGRWFLGHIFPYQTVKQEIDGVVLTFVDVTALKLAEAQLKLLNQELEKRVEERTRELKEAKEEAERRAAELEAVMEQVPAAVWITRDSEARHIVGNRAGYDMLRMDEADSGIENFFGENGLPSCRTTKGGRELLPSERPLRRAALGERVVGEELDLVFADGEVRTILGNATPLVDSQGNIFGAVASFMDITTRKQAEAGLKESEERFRTLVESAPDAIFVQTRGRFAYVNPAAATLLCGGRSADILGTPVVDCFHPEVAAIIQERIRRLNKDQLPVLKSEMQYRLRDGTPLDVDVSGVPVVYGGEHGALVFMRDVTERKQAEEARRESEEIYRGLFLNEHTVMFLVDPETGRFKDANPAASAFYGYSREEFLAMSVVQLNTQTPEQIRERIDSARQRRQSRFEFQHRLASGEIREVEVYSGPVRVQGRELLFSLVHDITERTRIGKALKASEARLRLAQEAAKAGTWEWDLRTNENIWSDEIWRLYGLVPQSSVPSYDLWLETVAPDDRPAVSTAVQQAAGSGAELGAEWRVNTPDGAVRWLMSRGQPQCDSAGRIVRYLGIVMDITALKLVESSLREREEQLRLFAEHAPASIAMFDTSMRYLAVSNRWLADFGLEGAQLLGRSHYEVFPEIPERWKAILQRCLAGAVEQAEADAFERADGRTQWLHWEVRPWYLDSGQVGGIIIFSEDITERKRAELEIRSLAKFPQENPNPVMRVSSELAVLYANLASRKFLSRFASEVGQPFPAQFNEPLQRAFATKEMQDFMVDVDGTVYAMTATPIADEGYVNIYGMDITARKLAEEAREKYLSELKTQREFLGSLIDNTPIAIGVVEGPEHRFILTNPAYEAILSDQGQSIVNRTLKEIFPSVQEHVAELFASVYATGRTVHLREYKVPIGSEITWWDAEYVPLHDAQGKVGRILIIGRNITATVHAAQALRASEERFRTLFDSMQEGVALHRMVYDDQGRPKDYVILDVNPAFVRVLGLSRESVVGQTSTAAYTVDEPPFLDIYAAVAGGGGSRYFEVDFAAMGKSFSISAVSPGPGLFATVFEDITERTRTQEALRQAKEAAEAANRIKGEFLANMSHELRTPLNGVLGMLQLLADMPLNDEQRLLLQTALESGRGLKAIINDILSFAQIEAGRIRINREECDIPEILGAVCRTFGYEASAKGLTLTCNVEANVPRLVLSDVVRIRQILVNLIGNSLKFTEEGRIDAHVTCLPPNSASADILLLFTVSDTGIGIADDKLTTIFEPFTQADGSLKRRYQGTGIGLSIVRLLVRLMGGTICVVSNTGDGSTFHFTIRCGSTRAAEIPANDQSAAPEADLTGLKVLLAEDDRINRFASTRFLEHLGCQVTAAVNGRQALELLAAGDFDCIIMDIQMPEMNGIEATQAIRSSTTLGAKAGIPILAMTAHAMVGDREQFLKAGMNDYLAKPVEADKLRQALARIIPSRRRQ